MITIHQGKNMNIMNPGTHSNFIQKQINIGLKNQ